MNRTVSVAVTRVARAVSGDTNHSVLAIAAGFVCLYVCVHWLSYVRPALTLGITPWHPQAGLILALLMLFGPRWFALAAIASFLAGFAPRLEAVGVIAMAAGSLWVAGVYTLTAELLRRWNLAEPIRTTIGATRIAGAMVAGTLAVAVGYVGIFVIAGDVPPSEALQATARYWVGELSGVLTITPLLLHAARWREIPRVVKEHPWEVLAQVIGIFLTFGMIFALPADEQLRFFYLLFVPIIWVSLRWALPGATLGVLAIQIALVTATHMEIPAPRFIDLQFLMLTLSLTALLLGAVVTERAGREAEQRALLAMAPDGVLAVDDVGRIQVANPAAQKLFSGNKESVQLRMLEDLLPDLQLRSVRGRETLEGHRDDGSAFPAEIAWARLDPPANSGFLVTVRDATDRHRAEEQLRERDAALARAMRFAVAGELASALAHELNQPITALVSYLRASEILAERGATDEEDRLRDTLNKAAREAIRASEVLRRLRDFYRGGALKQETLHLPALCDGVVRAFQERLRRLDATLVTAVEPDIPPLKGDATQLEIVLHNLIANALDAVAHSPVGNRRVVLRAACADRVVTLQVEDSGPGVGADVARKLFEPFVTSKPDGMGLGLAISRSLILARGGELTFAPASTLGGAVFTIRVPLDVPQDAPLI
jgi:PAS domain S-box-containing protein